jgi:hypothetical protein
MEELILNDQSILFDRDATIAVYRTIEGGDADRCDCATCKNFRLFRNQVYGPKLYQLLEHLGVDPLKEWEIYSVGVEIQGRIQCGGWFPFVGEWSSKNNSRQASSILSQDESFSFTDSFPNASKRFGSKVLAVEFEIGVPKGTDYISDWI